MDLRVNNDQAPKSARESGNVSDGARRSQFKAEATNAKLTATENEARKEKERSMQIRVFDFFVVKLSLLSVCVVLSQVFFG